MDKHNQIVQLREREREITFFPSGAAAAPQQPVLQGEEQEPLPLPLADRLWQAARPGLLKIAFVFGWLWVGVLVVKIGNLLINTGGLK